MELTQKNSGGLRVNMTQWPYWRYLVSFQKINDGSLKGAILAAPYDGKGSAYERDFKVVDWQAKVFLSSFDQQIGGFWGSSAGCTDGTPYQFERWENGKVLSGRGNAACQLHYAELEALMGEALVLELHDAPFDWHGWFDDKRFLILEKKGE